MIAATAAALAWLALYYRAHTVWTRRWLLGAATLAAGAWLSYGHLEARRLSVLLFLCSLALVAAVWRAVAADVSARARRGAIGGLIALFVAFKWTAGQERLYGWLHLPHRYLITAGAWLGGSYILFRLIHVLIESEKPGAARPSLYELFVYALFPPTLIAGPIDRWNRFRSEAGLPAPGAADLVEGARRIVTGVVKKFVVADFLGQLPIDAAHAALSAPRSWASLYLYGFQLYFDFAGYSDIAIGAARCIGFHVPENFDSPYLKRNLTRFWQSWHATLSSWMRDYLFFPLGKLFRRRAAFLSADAAVLLCNVATMVTIGLWHGLRATYAAWGLWHGIGLFAAKKWADRRRARGAPEPGWASRLAAGLLTFQFVMVGWVFFYAGSVRGAFDMLAHLAGRG